MHLYLERHTAENFNHARLKGLPKNHVLIFFISVCLCIIPVQIHSAANPDRSIGEERTDAWSSFTVDPFQFIVTCDQRQYTGPGTYDTVDYFRGVCEAIENLGSGRFMVSPGDIDPPADSLWTIEQYIGMQPDYLWYPGVGNHEAETPADMDWLRGYNPGGDTLPYIVNIGPPGTEETTYSFDYNDVHFVQLNEYYDGVSDTGTDGDVEDALYNWLVDDLNNTALNHIFVLGHEAAWPQPDEQNGRMRHLGDCLDQYPANRDRFWNLLRNRGVTAYIHGHTHNYSLVDIDGVWQMDAGHARGLGDTGALSTFLFLDIDGDDALYATYRGSGAGGSYLQTDTGFLDCLQCATYVFQDGRFPGQFYYGTRDTYIDSSVPHGGATTLIVDGDPDAAVIIKWDISDIPEGSVVHRAWITLNVTNTSAQTYQIYRMKRDWEEDAATWNDYSSSGSWEIPGAEGPDDRGLISLGDTAYNFAGGMYMISLNEDGLRLIESWIVDPGRNHGLIITDYGNSDSVRFDSRESAIVENRPKLTIFLEQDEDFLDCNRNGDPDWFDIRSGRSEDCNQNGIPDECEVGPPLLQQVIRNDESEFQQGWNRSFQAAREAGCIPTPNDRNGNCIPDACEYSK